MNTSRCGSCSVYLYVMIATTFALPYDGWTEHTSPHLPRGISNNAVGYDPSNHTIWLLGAYFAGDAKQLISFNYTDNTFTDYGETYLPRRVSGLASNYVQIGVTLYMADFDDSYINSFNMQTMTFTYNAARPPWDFSNYGHECFVNIRNEYIAVLNKDRRVQIVNIETKQWLDSVPSSLSDRTGSSCAYINDKIFYMGGTLSYSIEYLNVSTASMSNIGSISWRNTPDPLPYLILNSCCITINDDILLIGGIYTASGDSSTRLDAIYVIDSITFNVSVRGYLSKAVHSCSSIFVNNNIYSFGGNIPQGQSWSAWDGWQVKSGIPTGSPISSPTSNPTIPEPHNSKIETTNIETTNIETLFTTSMQSSLGEEQTIALPQTTSTPVINIGTSLYSITETSAKTTKKEYDSNIWNGTMITITLTVDDSVSIDGVLHTINNTISNYLITKNIMYPLNIDIIQREGTPTFIVIFAMSHKLNENEINSKEIENEIKTDLNNKYDGEVKVEFVTITVNQYDDINNDNAENVYLWVILVLTVIVMLILIGCAVVLAKQSTKEPNNSDKIHMKQSVTQDKQMIQILDVDVLKERKKNAADNESEGYVKHDLISSYKTPVALKRRVNNDALDIQYWLENVVQLPQYFKHFMDSGYESMDFIKEIPNITELSEIGIESKHQREIFEEIKKLKGEQMNDTLGDIVESDMRE